jgi:hypothetical protein
LLFSHLNFTAIESVAKTPALPRHSFDALVSGAETSLALLETALENSLELKSAHMAHVQSVLIHLVYLTGVESYWTNDDDTQNAILARNANAADTIYNNLCDLSEWSGCMNLQSSLSKKFEPVFMERVRCIQR